MYCLTLFKLYGNFESNQDIQRSKMTFKEALKGYVSSPKKMTEIQKSRFSALNEIDKIRAINKTISTHPVAEKSKEK